MKFLLPVFLVFVLGQVSASEPVRSNDRNCLALSELNGRVSGNSECLTLPLNCSNVGRAHQRVSAGDIISAILGTRLDPEEYCAAARYEAFQLFATRCYRLIENCRQSGGTPIYERVFNPAEGEC